MCSTGTDHRKWTLTQSELDNLLAWLDSDRERAGRRYEEIRRTLIKTFICRGCANAEDLADETIDRVVRKLAEIRETYVGNPALYFSGVAKFVLLENERKRTELPLLGQEPINDIDFEEGDGMDREYECLEICLQHLKPKRRELVLEYYRQGTKIKKATRRALAELMGLKSNALRARVSRIRENLEECIVDCLKQQQVKS